MANFTQQELEIISTAYADIQSRMNGNNAINPNDKPIAEGYALMANLLKNRLESDKTLTADERESKRRVGACTHAVEHDKQCSHFSGSLKYSDD